MSNTGFSERLMRIEAGLGHTRHTLFVGMDDSFSVAPKLRAQGVGPAGSSGNRLSPLTYIAAFVLGCLAVLVGTLGRFHLMGLPGPEADADIAMTINAAISLTVGFALARMFRFGSKDLLLAQSAGIFAALCLMHNAVHLAPAPFAVIYAPEWVDHILTLTDFGSVHFRGVTFPF